MTKDRPENSFLSELISKSSDHRKRQNTVRVKWTGTLRMALWVLPGTKVKCWIKEINLRIKIRGFFRRKKTSHIGMIIHTSHKRIIWVAVRSWEIEWKYLHCKAHTKTFGNFKIWMMDRSMRDIIHKTRRWDKSCNMPSVQVLSFILIARLFLDTHIEIGFAGTWTFLPSLCITVLILSDHSSCCAYVIRR